MSFAQPEIAKMLEDYENDLYGDENDRFVEEIGVKEVPYGDCLLVEAVV